MMANSNNRRRNLILNLINHLGPISRTELINLTGFRPANVGVIIKELLDEKIIIEAGLAANSHGRKRVLLAMNSHHLYAIGISVQPSHVTLLAACIDGTVLTEQVVQTQDSTTDETLLDRVARHTEGILQQFADKEVLGIAIAQSSFDHTHYKLEHSLAYNRMHYFDWVRYDLKPRLEAVSGMPVEIFSEEGREVLSVLAEYRYGVAKGVENFLVITLVNGIGCGIFANGAPISGATGQAGQIGHMLMDYGAQNPPICYCGKPGCVETQASYPALVAHLEDAMAHGVLTSLRTHIDPEKGITVEAIRKALAEGDQLCMYHVKAVARRIGAAIANVINLLNPEVVVLNGFMMELGEYFLKHLEEATRENTLSFFKEFAFCISPEENRLLPLGAVSLIFASYLSSEDYKWVYRLQPGDLEAYSFTEAEDI